MKLLALCSYVYRWQFSQAILAWSQQFTSVQWLEGIFAIWCPPVRMDLFLSGATTVSDLENTHSCEYLMVSLSLLWEGRFTGMCVLLGCRIVSHLRRTETLTAPVLKLAKACKMHQLLELKCICLVVAQRVYHFTKWWETCIILKYKSKVSPVHARKAYRGSRDIAPLIHNLSARWSWVANFVIWLLYSNWNYFSGHSLISCNE